MSLATTLLPIAASGLFGGGIVTAATQLVNQRRDYRLRIKHADTMGPVERESLQVKTTGEAVAILAKAADVANARAEAAEKRAADLQGVLDEMRKEHEQLWDRYNDLNERCSKLSAYVEQHNGGILPPDMAGESGGDASRAGG